MRISIHSARSSPGHRGSHASVGAHGGTVAVMGHRFLAEVAATRAAREKGLMHRSSLAEDRCMMFFHDEDGAHGIWMKNCLIPLDVIWITAEGRVVAMAEAIPPSPPLDGGDYPIYGGAVPSRHFIEFPAGTIKKTGLKTGDRIGWDLEFDSGSALVVGTASPGGRPRSRPGEKLCRNPRARSFCR